MEKELTDKLKWISIGAGLAGGMNAGMQQTAPTPSASTATEPTASAPVPETPAPAETVSVSKPRVSTYDELMEQQSVGQDEGIELLPDVDEHDYTYDESRIDNSAFYVPRDEEESYDDEDMYEDEMEDSYDESYEDSYDESDDESEDSYAQALSDLDDIDDDSFEDDDFEEEDLSMDDEDDDLDEDMDEDMDEDEEFSFADDDDDEMDDLFGDEAEEYEPAPFLFAELLAEAAEEYANMGIEERMDEMGEDVIEITVEELAAYIKEQRKKK